MFSGFTEETVSFLWNLRLNNEKPWFEAHKDDFIRHFQTPMKELSREVFERVSADFDRGFIHKVSRIYKDARRVKGGEPYRDHLWFSVERPSEEWTCTPVFWFELDPEQWCYGLGYYAPRAKTMAKFRARLDANTKAFEKLVAPFEKQHEFVLWGDEYKRKKEAPSPGTAAWYNRKSISLIHSQQNSNELYSPELADRIVNGFSFLMPIYDYFITIDSDPEPC